MTDKDNLTKLLSAARDAAAGQTAQTAALIDPHPPDDARAKENMNPRPDGQGGIYRNPNTKPGGLEPESLEAANAILGVMVEDVAGRLTRAETKEIQRHIVHAVDDRKRFDEWLAYDQSAHGLQLRGPDLQLGSDPLGGSSEP